MKLHYQDSDLDPEFRAINERTERETGVTHAQCGMVPVGATTSDPAAVDCGSCLRSVKVKSLLTDHCHTMTDTARPLDLLGEDAMQLGHTINMVADLPRYLVDGTTAHGPELHAHVRHAITESFAINAALLAQFIDEQIRHRLDPDDHAFLAELSETVNAHVTHYGKDRRNAPLAEIPAQQWRTKLFELLDQVPLPEPLATWRSDARLTADYIGLDVLGEWKP